MGAKYNDLPIDVRTAKIKRILRKDGFIFKNGVVLIN